MHGGGGNPAIWDIQWTYNSHIYNYSNKSFCKIVKKSFMARYILCLRKYEINQKILKKILKFILALAHCISGDYKAGGKINHFLISDIIFSQLNNLLLEFRMSLYG